MDPQYAPASPIEPPSLKEIAQDLFLNTLDPAQRLQIAIKSLSQIPDDDLAGIPLATIERCIAARAAAPITQALLERLPQLKDRIKATNHSHKSQSLERKFHHHSTKTTYVVFTVNCDLRTLVVNTVNTTLESRREASRSIHLDIKYGAVGLEGTSASFKLDEDFHDEGTTHATLQSSNLQQLLTVLSDDLSLPIKRSAELDARERELATNKAVYDSSIENESESRAVLREYMRKDLRHLRRPATKYPLPELQTPDAKQRDITFGKLIEALLPEDFREEGLESRVWEFGFMWPEKGFLSTGSYTVEALLVGAAVAGVDLDKTIDPDDEADFE